MNNITESWASYYADIAKVIATKSKDTTKVGAIAVDPRTRRILATGYNGFPPKVNDNIPERNQRPNKYDYVVHAEANIVAQCARHGINLEGAVIFVTMHPCADCCKLLIAAGIKGICYIEDVSGNQEWHKKLSIAKEMLTEAEVELVKL